MTDKEKSEIYTLYCGNNMSMLRKICDPVITRKNIPQMYWDDLYSDAMKVLMESVESYSPTRNCSFATYLIGNINRSFYDFTRDNMREKRCNVRRDKNWKTVKDSKGDSIPINDVPLNAINEDGVEIGDLIPDDKDLLKIDELFGLEGMSPDMAVYLGRLSLIEAQIVSMLANGYSPKDIRILLGLESKEYKNHMLAIKTYESIRILM